MIERGNYKDLKKDKKDWKFSVDNYLVGISREELYTKLVKSRVRYSQVKEAKKLYEEQNIPEDWEGYTEEEKEILMKTEKIATERKFMPDKNRILLSEGSNKEIDDVLILTIKFMVERGYILPNWEPHIYTYMFLDYYAVEGDVEKFQPVYQRYFESLNERKDLGFLIDKVKKNGLRGWESIMELNREFKDDDTKVKALLYDYYPYLEEYIRGVIGNEWGGTNTGSRDTIASNHIETKLEHNKNGNIDKYKKEFYKSLWVSIIREFNGEFRADKDGNVVVYSEWMVNRNTVTHGRVNPDGVAIGEVYALLALLEYLHEYKRFLKGEDIKPKKTHSLYSHIQEKINGEEVGEKREVITYMRVADKDDGSFEKPHSENEKFFVPLGKGAEEVISLEILELSTYTNTTLPKELEEKIYEYRESLGEGYYILTYVLKVCIDMTKYDIYKEYGDINIGIGVVDGKKEDVYVSQEIELTSIDLSKAEVDRFKNKRGHSLGVEIQTVFEIPKSSDGVRIKVCGDFFEKYIRAY